jgi:methyltransferase (TIGR00027 family)
MPIEHISDTARWVAEYRAMETDRPDAIFRDPFARRLAGPLGAEIANSKGFQGRMAWVIIVRTAVLDSVVMHCVKDGADMVINLAAGLDTRPWRMDLPASLRWVDIDLPGILGHKTKELANEKPRCHYEPVMLDLSDTAARNALLARLGASCKRALVITEGLLIYLEPSMVADLGRALHAQSSFQWWVTDLAGPRLLNMVGRSSAKALADGPAKFKFAPAEGSGYFAPLGWREKAYWPNADEGRRLNRQMRGMWFWRLVGMLYPRRLREEFKRISGNLLLERA